MSGKKTNHDDVTRLEALHREHDLLQDILDLLPDLICVKDCRGRYLFDNLAHRQFIGVRNLEDVLGKTLHDFLPPDKAALNEQGDAEALATGTPIQKSNEIFCGHGRFERHMATTRCSFRNKEGQACGVICIGRDITDQILAEEALSQERYLLHALMDNIPDNIYFKNRKTEFIRINNAMARWFHLQKPEDALGKTDFDFFSEEHARQAFDDEETIMRTGKPVIGIEEKETWPDGSVTWVSTTKEPLHNERGEIIGTFGLSRDITQLKEAKDALASREQRMREEMQLAKAVHSALMPLKTPDVPGLTFGLKFVPTTDIGGDFVDFITFRKGKRIGIFFGDLTGHGVAAALLSAMLKVLINEELPTSSDLSASFKILNQRLSSEFPQGCFASTFYAVINVETRTMSYVNASQDPAILLRKGEAPQFLGGNAPPLGMMPPECLLPEDYQTQFVQLHPEDTLFFYTDGLTNLCQGDTAVTVTPELLAEWLDAASGLDPQSLVTNIYKRALTYADITETDDDVAALAVRLSC